MLEFRLLGPLEIANDGLAVPLEGAKPRALLALLLLERGRSVTTRRLGDGLWGPAAPASAAKALQVHVSQLRKALGASAIETRGDAYAIHAPAGAVDLDTFEQLAEAGRSRLGAGRPAEALEPLSAALALWRGDALEGLDEPGLTPARARLEELRVVVHELLADARIAIGDTVSALPELTLLAHRYPLREGIQERLMLALYRSGRQADALAVFRSLRARLHDELGLEPRRRVRALEQAILRQDAALETPGRTVRRVVVAAGSNPGRLAALAAPLVRPDGGELILLVPVAEPGELADASVRLEAERSEDIRVATFVSAAPRRDVLRLGAAEGASLVVLETAAAELVTAGSDSAAGLPADLALFVDAAGPLPGERVSVLQAGGGHDWAAIELAAALARGAGVSLRLLGPGSSGEASTLLARTALVVQRFAGIATEPALFAPGAAASLGALVADGVLVAAVDAPVPEPLTELGVPLVVVRGGPRPGLLAPAQTITRFSWALG